MLASGLTKFGKPLRVTLARDYRPQHGQATHTSGVGQHQIELEVHVPHRLDHVIDVRCSTLDQLGPIASKCTQRADFGIGTKRGLEKAQCMELLEPLGIIPISLASRNGLDMACIDQIGNNSGLLQQLIDWDPKDARRFHYNCVDAACLEPGHECLEIDSKGLKCTYWERIAIWRIGNDNCVAADVEASRIGVRGTKDIAGLLERKGNTLRQPWS